MIRMYRDVAILALRRASTSWLAAVSIPLYAIAFIWVARLSAPLGLIGGLVTGFVGAAFFGAYLSMVATAVAGGKVRLADLRSGLRAVWDVISVFFALWVISLGVSVVQRAAGSNATAVGGVVALAGAILLNPVPELIYSSSSRSFAVLKESVSFVMENPVAWFAPNLLFAFAILWATGTLTLSSPAELLLQLASLASIDGVLHLVGGAPRWMMPLLIVFVHVVMVFRGLLYRELTSGSSRMRAFRRHMGT
jgi:hypothetical protein